MIKAEVQGDVKEINRLLSMIPGVTQQSAYTAGLRPAGKVIERRLRALTPRSSKTGSTKRWSAKTRRERSGEKPLYMTTATKVYRTSDGRGIVYVGYRWPIGNKAHFVFKMKKDSRKVVSWGRHTGRETQKYDDIRKQAIDETKEQARDAFTGGVRSDVEKRLARFKNA